eukprot:7389134-Prymnesium_polylepis.3
MCPRHRLEPADRLTAFIADLPHRLVPRSGCCSITGRLLATGSTRASAPSTTFCSPLAALSDSSPPRRPAR